MAFPANPLSLSVPEPAFETWLRDSGFLQILDHHNSTPSSSGGGGSPARRPSSNRISTRRRIGGVLEYLRTLAAVATMNPFAKLSAEDFAGPTPPWAAEFVGPAGSYGWPAGPAQARMRAQENVRRFARNYAALALLAMASALYRMPVCLVGVMASIGLWELLRYCSNRWELEQRFPALRHALVRIAQIATAVILYLCNIQLAVVYALGASYTVMLWHASFRKLAPPVQSTGASPYRRTLFGRVLSTVK